MTDSGLVSRLRPYLRARYLVPLGIGLSGGAAVIVKKKVENNVVTAKSKIANELHSDCKTTKEAYASKTSTKEIASACERALKSLEPFLKDVKLDSKITQNDLFWIKECNPLLERKVDDFNTKKEKCRILNRIQGAQNYVYSFMPRRNSGQATQEKK